MLSSLARAGPSSRILYLLGASLLVLNIAVSVMNWAALRSARPKTLDAYTFEGDDFPDYYPMKFDTVALTPENSMHYHIWDPSNASQPNHDINAVEWRSVYPPGGGFVFLGPQKRPFGLAMFHQHHCLEKIRIAMAERRDNQHVRHCLAYMRQSIMCEASPVIEPVVPILGRRSVNAETPRVCRDWTQVYELSEKSWRDAGGRD